MSHSVQNGRSFRTLTEEISSPSVTKTASSHECPTVSEEATHTDYANNIKGTNVKFRR